MAPRLYDIRLSFNLGDDQDAIERLWEAFSGKEPHLARPTGIKADGAYLTVDFDAVPDDPTFGATSVEHGARGAEVVAALEGFSHQHTLVVPVLRALLTLAAMREKAGLPPREEMRVDVVPATPRSQEELSTHLGGGPRERREFGTLT